MNRHAFTLMELLVVVGIILVLMGLLVPAVGMARRASQRAKTVATIGQVAAAIDQYRSLNAVYPELYKIPAPATLSATQQAELQKCRDASTWLATLTTGEVFDEAFGPNTAVQPATSISDDKWEGINVVLTYQLGSLISDTAKDGKLLDVWGKPLRYRPSKWYRFDTANVPRIDSNEPPGQDSYQLWSLGVNPTDAEGLADPGEGGDDIPQWAKKSK